MRTEYYTVIMSSVNIYIYIYISIFSFKIFFPKLVFEEANMVLMLVIAFQGGKKKQEFVNGTGHLLCCS